MWLGIWPIAFIDDERMIVRRFTLTISPTKEKPRVIQIVGRNFRFVRNEWWMQITNLSDRISPIRRLLQPQRRFSIHFVSTSTQWFFPGWWTRPDGRSRVRQIKKLRFWTRIFTVSCIFASSVYFHFQWLALMAFVINLLMNNVITFITEFCIWIIYRLAVEADHRRGNVSAARAHVENCSIVGPKHFVIIAVNNYLLII